MWWGIYLVVVASIAAVEGNYIRLAEIESPVSFSIKTQYLDQDGDSFLFSVNRTANRLEGVLNHLEDGNFDYFAYGADFVPAADMPPLGRNWVRKYDPVLMRGNMSDLVYQCQSQRGGKFPELEAAEEFSIFKKFLAKYGEHYQIVDVKVQHQDVVFSESGRIMSRAPAVQWNAKRRRRNAEEEEEVSPSSTASPSITFSELSRRESRDIMGKYKTFNTHNSFDPLFCINTICFALQP